MDVAVPQAKMCFVMINLQFPTVIIYISGETSLIYMLVGRPSLYGLIVM